MKAIEFIRKFHPFDWLTEDELVLIEKPLEKPLEKPAEEPIQELSFSKGTKILEQEGPASHHLYVIRKGSVQLIRGERVIQILEEGELFGFPSMLGSHAPTATVTANEDVLVYLIPEENFQKLLANQKFAGFFLKQLSDRLRQITDQDTPPPGESLTSPIMSLVTRSLVAVNSDATVTEAAQVMRNERVSCVIVKGESAGIITDRDLRSRVLAEGRDGATKVTEVMSCPVKTVAADTPIYGAVLFMFEEHIHHLPITKKSEISGLITSTDLLRHQAHSPLYLLKRIEQFDETPESLACYAPRVIETVETLYKGGLNAVQIGRVVSTLNGTLVKRLLRLAEDKLGPPPTPYAWLVFGSEGRMEQTLLTDQDNGLVYLEDSPQAEAYFSGFAEYVVDRLIQAGFPPCTGGYMATNWRRPLQEWVKLFRGWIERPDPQAILEAAIFFDFRRVHGKLSVDPIQEVVSKAQRHGIFLAHLAQTALQFRPPLGFFGRIRQKDGLIDLKEGGIAPIVGLARVYALEAGSLGRSTLDRLDAAAEAGKLSRQGAENLKETFRFLQRLRLRAQLDQLKQSRPLDNNIRFNALTNLERRYLKEAFSAIREIQEAAEMRYLTGMLG